MDFAYLLTPTSAPVIKKYQVSSTILAGVPVIQPAANSPGLDTCTTTNCDNMVGCTIDRASDLQGNAQDYATAQQSDGSDPAVYCSVIINPDAVWAAKISGGATENTALTEQTVTTASTTGLDVTTGAEWSSPTYDEGVVWGYSGANAGIIRKLTSVSTTAGTVTVAFPADIAVGDTFLRAPFFPGGAATVTLTTLLTQIRADVAVATNTSALRLVEFRLLDQSMRGAYNSFALVKSGNHIFGGVLS